MGYQSFPPGGHNQNQASQASEQVSQSHRLLSSKFVGIIALTFIVAGVTYGVMWYWQLREESKIPIAIEVKDFETCFRFVHGFEKKAVSQCQAPDGTIYKNPTWSQSTDETATWKTYMNAEYGFEIKYPSSYTLNTNTRQLVSATNLIEFNFWPSLPASSSSYDPSTQFTRISVDGYEAYKSGIDGGMDTTYYSVAIKNSAGNYLATTFTSYDIGAKSQINEKAREFDQILSTFKFIDPVVSSECSGKETTEIGGSEYPVSAKYLTLGAGLGSYLTAEDCSATRLSEVVKNQYPRPEHIILNQLPPMTLVTVLRRIGLMPSPEKCANKPERSCIDWRPLKESDLVPANLVQLRPFIDFIKSADCYFCG